ncbi:MAG: hypothetical protein U1E37_12435 [Sphingomonadaceae bacterium]
MAGTVDMRSKTAPCREVPQAVRQVSGGRSRSAWGGTNGNSVIFRYPYCRVAEERRVALQFDEPPTPCEEMRFELRCNIVTDTFPG